MWPEMNGKKFWSHSFHLPNSDILQARMDEMGDLIKINFDNFQILQKYSKWISQIVRAQKGDEKNGIFCLVTFFLPELWSLICPK